MCSRFQRRLTVSFLLLLVSFLAEVRGFDVLSAGDRVSPSSVGLCSLALDTVDRLIE